MSTVVSDSKPTTGGPWYYAGQRNGINIWTTTKPAGQKTDSTKSDGGGTSSSTSSAHGKSTSSGTGEKGLSQYVQEYRLRFFADGTPPADLLQQAKDKNWSIAYFDQRIRSDDPKYLKSKEAKTLLPEFNRTMKILFPGLSDRTKQIALMKNPFYRRTANWYLRNGVAFQQGGEELLYSRITGTKQWNRQNPYWKMYARNANPAVQAEMNPLAYKAHLDALKQAFTQYNMEMPEDYYKAFFRSRYASKTGFTDFAENLKNLAEQGTSLAWMQAKPVSKGQTKELTLGESRLSASLRERLAKAFEVRSSFLASDEKGPQTSLSDSGLVQPLI